MQVNKVHNFFFHPLDKTHSTKTKIASTITIIALSIFSGFIYLSIFAIVNLRDRYIRNATNVQTNDIFRDVYDLLKKKNDNDLSGKQESPSKPENSFSRPSPSIPNFPEVPISNPPETQPKNLPNLASQDKKVSFFPENIDALLPRNNSIEIQQITNQPEFEPQEEIFVNLDSADMSALSHENHSTAKILQDPNGFNRSDQEPGLRLPYGYVGNVQGHHQFRQTVAEVTKTDFRALSPEALRKNRHVNPATSLTLTAKHVGHALSLTGHMSLPNRMQTNLEGFSEVFTLPMIAESFERFALKNADIVSKEMGEWVLDAFTKATRNDALTEEQIKEHLKELSNAPFKGPLCVSSGYDWHGTFLVFYRNFVFYMNRGADPYALQIDNGEEIPELSGSGTSIFKTDDMSLNLSLEIATKMFKRMTVPNSNSAKMQHIQQELNLIFMDRIKSKKQSVGNCTYANTKLALKTLIALYLLKDQEHINIKDFDTAFKQAKMIYKAWVKFDRHYVVKNLVEEIKTLQNENKTNTFVYEFLKELLYKALNKRKNLVPEIQVEIASLNLNS